LFTGQLRGTFVCGTELIAQFIEEGKAEVACHQGKWDQTEGYKTEFPSEGNATPQDQ